MNDVIVARRLRKIWLEIKRKRFDQVIIVMEDTISNLGTAEVRMPKDVRVALMEFMDFSVCLFMLDCEKAAIENFEMARKCFQNYIMSKGLMVNRVKHCRDVGNLEVLPSDIQQIILDRGFNR
jgi:hypothetical protein